jgi:hypothetical protein
MLWRRNKARCSITKTLLTKSYSRFGVNWLKYRMSIRLKLMMSSRSCKSHLPCWRKGGWSHSSTVWRLSSKRRNKRSTREIRKLRMSSGSQIWTKRLSRWLEAMRLLRLQRLFRKVRLELSRWSEAMRLFKMVRLERKIQENLIFCSKAN